MANDLNLCQFIGRLGQDPSIRYSGAGTAFAELNLAVGKSWKDRATGEKREHTEWVRVILSGKIAETAAQYLTKGSRIYVSGELATRKWQDQSGQDRYTTEIKVGMNGRLQMLDSPNRQQGAGQPQGQQQRQAHPQQRANQARPTQQQRQAMPDPVDDFDDDIPF